MVLNIIIQWLLRVQWSQPYGIHGRIDGFESVSADGFRFQRSQLILINGQTLGI